MPSTLTHLVSRFTEAFTASLEASADRALTPFIESLRGVAHGLAQPHLHPHRDHPALSFLEQATGAARADERLCTAIRALLPYLSFGSSYAAEGSMAAVSRGMVWAEVVGRTGLVRDSSRRIGCFLLAPGHFYPLHGHIPDEIYFVVSGPLTVEHGLRGARVAIPPGGYYHTPSGQPHALHVGDQPVLLAYSWVGDFDAPIWFLEKDGDGGWSKNFPTVVRR
ncbi:MAG: dimethylsulfonioproprionate lyase family protein [Hyphomicrobiaceae bacterium]